MPIHPRNERYKNMIMSAPYEICVERARYFTESYRKTKGEHPAMRAAKAFEHTLRNMTVIILDEEKIVGNRSSKLISAVIPVERGDINTVLKLDLDLLMKREKQPFHISPAEKKELMEEILPYWEGKTLRDRKKKLWKDNGLYFKPAYHSMRLIRHIKDLDFSSFKIGDKSAIAFLPYIFKSLKEVAYNNPAFVMNVFDVQGHLILGIKNIMREGFSGIKTKAQDQLAQLEKENQDGRMFLQAVILCCDAMKNFAARFAEEAEKLAAGTTDPERKKDLLRAATGCRHVPFNPPRNFFEAIQSLWLTQVGAFIAYGMGGIFAIGRFDQYLYPFYAQDKAAGLITELEATEWLEELLIKLSYNLLLIPMIGKMTGSELGSDSCAPTIGGVDREGLDIVNDLSYLILDAFENVKSMGNSFSIRLSDKSTEAFWRRALAVYRKTSGAALFYDEKVIKALECCGCRPEDARDYGVIGCVEPSSDGNTFGCTSGNDISLTAALEMAFLNGHLRIMGKRVGPATGDPRKFQTFDQFMDAFKKQVDFMIQTVAKAVNLKDQAYRDEFPNPYVSATLAGCVENAKDMTNGGARYNFGSISARGLGTVADSLAAVKHFIYDEPTISMSRMIRMLDKNFKGYEKIRVMLANKGAKYGNDDDQVDAIAKDVAEYFCREVSRCQTIRGGPFRPSFFSYGMHVLEGLFLGATPNGRRAGEPVSNSFSPANGSERNGPTAMLRSVAKIDHSLISNGCALNLKLLPYLYEGEERLDKMVALVKGFFALGGMELQPNVVSSKILREAQLHPEIHRDLVVRVSGYSAFFCDLGKPLQDEIIQRTEFDCLGN